MVRPLGSVARTWKALAAVVAMALVAVVLIATPGSATFAKKYDLVMSSTPSPITAGTSATVNATFKNKSLYSIGSVSLTVPSTKYTIAPNPTIPSGTATITIGADGRQTLSITGIKLILNQPYTITMTVAVTCDAATGSWGSTAKLFGGSTMFTLNNPGNAQKTTVSGSCPPDSIQFLQGPTTTTAGGPFSPTITVQVRSGSNTVSGVSVTLASDGLDSSPSATTNGSGIATFTGLTAGTVAGSYTMKASAGSLQTPDAPFDITAGPPALVEFSAQPTDTEVGAVINAGGGVLVHVTDEFGNDVPDYPVGIEIGFDPTDAATLGGTPTATTDSDGVATFDDLTISPSSSGYQLKATAGTAPPALSGSVDVPTFAITSTAPDGCTGGADCTVSIDDDSTVTAPPGTTLIVETNQLNCSGFLTDPIAGTVTIIPDPDVVGGIPITFDDVISFPIEGPYPFCKTPNHVTADQGPVPFCEDVLGLDQDNDGVACLTQEVALHGPNPPTLQSILWINAVDPIGRH